MTGRAAEWSLGWERMDILVGVPAARPFLLTATDPATRRVLKSAVLPTATAPSWPTI